MDIKRRRLNLPLFKLCVIVTWGSFLISKSPLEIWSMAPAIPIHANHCSLRNLLMIVFFAVSEIAPYVSIRPTHGIKSE